MVHYSSGNFEGFRDYANMLQDLNRSAGSYLATGSALDKYTSGMMRSNESGPSGVESLVLPSDMYSSKSCK